MSSSESKRPTHGFTLTSQSSIGSLQSGLASTSNSTKKETPIAPKGGKTSNTVVESGQEHTGRWTREEHEAFLQALQQYGKEWKKVAAKVKTRTVVQTRTHAQKYFQKLQKGLANDKGDVEMGTVAEAKKILPIASVRRGQTSSAKKKRKGSGPNSLLATAMSTQKRQSAAATQAAAQLMTQISQVNTMNEEQTMLSPSAMMNKHSTHFVHPGVYSGQSNFSRASFSTAIDSNSSSASIYSAGTNFAAPVPGSQMKIIAPRPEHTMKKNMFPEPSPAACGKRKAIELAAAQMLAGVAASSGNSVHQSREISGRTTPPPENRSAVDRLGKSTMEIGVNSLQIINPENLGIKNESNQVMKVGHEPTTPWDGELEALVSEVNGKGKEDQIEGTISSSGTIQDKDTTPIRNFDRTGERNALHTAVRKGSIQEVEVLLSSISWGKSVLNALDNTGFPPLHSAVALPRLNGGENVALAISHFLISAGATVTCTDAFGNSPLHWAARVGNVKVLEMLAIENCPLDMRNDMGETALHWAMRAGKVGIETTQFLLQNGARSLFTKAFLRPLDLAAEGFSGVCEDAYPLGTDGRFVEETQQEVESALIQERRHCRANLLSLSPQSRTLVLHHPECLEHLPKSETDWEAPDRVNVIMDALLRNDDQSVRGYEIQVSQEFDRASLEFLSRVHSAEYLTFVNNLSKELEKRHSEETVTKNTPSVVPFTPMVQRTVMREPTVKKGSHSDTSFSSGSLRAARRAAGAVKHAVDCVLVGRNRNAFCVVRPPGHHAGINGLLDGGESCGFCLFNNVAAGAMHALSDENPRPNCERCAIVDIDVHHGNGTEEIVKKCDNPGRLFFFSVHLFDNDKRKGKTSSFKFYPGTGDDDDVAHNVINVPIAPMWKEKNYYLPKSANISPSAIETRHSARNKSKQKAVSTSETSNGITEENSSEKGTAPKTSGQEPDTRTLPQALKERKHAPNSFLYGTGREAYRQAIQQRLLPALRAFNPDLILISLGLDASGKDVGNARHYRNGKEMQGIDLKPEDYAWSTRKIMEVADICCQGRVVSVLEGGYGSTRRTSPPGEDPNVETNKLDKSVISECALRHVQALIDPHDVEMRHR